MRLNRWILRAAGLYGLIVLLPQYALEKQVGIDRPPAITHPEYFYGFVGVAVAWQVAFLIMSRDPARYRPLLIAAILEKISFGGAAIALYAAGRLDALVLLFGTFDLVWATLFAWVYVRLCSVTRRDEAA